MKTSTPAIEVSEVAVKLNPSSVPAFLFESSIETAFEST